MGTKAVSWFVFECGVFSRLLINGLALGMKMPHNKRINERTNEKKVVIQNLRILPSLNQIKVNYNALDLKHNFQQAAAPAPTPTPRTHERKTLKSKHNFACFFTSLGGFCTVTERVALHIFPYHKTLSQEPKFANNNLKLIFLLLFFRSVWIRVQVKLSVLMNFFAIFHSGKVGNANKIIIYENYTMKMMRMLQFIHLFYFSVEFHLC